jgi:fused signal recognition particle receptor
MFNFIKNKISQIYQTIKSPFQSIFAQNTIDEQTLDNLHQLLLKADTGVQTTNKIIANLRSKQIETGTDLQNMLAQELQTLLITKKQSNIATAQILFIIGVNGTGKTTCTAKLASYFKLLEKSCIIAAADTFRAAAVQQLQTWGKQLDIPVIAGGEKNDPAAVVFDACSYMQQHNTQLLIIDTAGRLQNKENLMQELAKMKRVINKTAPQAQVCTLLTVDAMLGQNSLDQARLFDQIASIDGIILTKMDGTAKGGIAVAIAQELDIPIVFLSAGEQIDDLAEFDKEAYVKRLLGIDKE